MSISETNMLAFIFTSITVTEEKNAPTQAEVIRKYKTKKLIDFLHKEKDLELSETAIKFLKRKRLLVMPFSR